MNIDLWAIILVLVLLIIVFNTQIIYLIKAVRTSLVSAISGQDPHSLSCDISDDDDIKRYENLENDPKANSMAPEPQMADSLLALGYTGDLPWDEVIQVSELDPSTFINHQDFVKDVRRFSSGANFTSVTDDNTNLAFTNFIGLRRPEGVKIGAGARQVPDVDESVLLRNKVFRWNSTS